MDQVSVPDTETTYMCMTFDLPSETSYHIIADEPIVDNANAVHHMLIYGCSSLDGENIIIIKQNLKKNPAFFQLDPNVTRLIQVYRYDLQISICTKIHQLRIGLSNDFK